MSIWDVNDMASIGYARVSTKDQNLDMQIDALREAGCDPIFSESVSSSKERPLGIYAGRFE